jgi:GT2 family glycosyltransferase
MIHHVIELELSESLPRLGPDFGVEVRGVLARWHGRPVGFLLRPGLPDAPLEESALMDWIQRECVPLILGIQAEAALASRWPRQPPPSAPSLTLAVCTRDRPERLERLLRSLSPAIRDSRFAATQIVVVDNSPSDGRTRELVHARFPDVRYVLEPRAGLDFARNAALDAATCEWIAFLDDDVVVDRHWLDGLYTVWSEVPEAGGYTGLVLPFRLDTPAQLHFEQLGGFRRGFERIHHRSSSFDNPLHPVGAGVVGAGCNMVFRRDLLQSLGGFDEALDTGSPLPGGGDLDIFYRVLRAGWTIVYEPRLTVYHEHRETLTQLRRQYWSWGLGFMAFLSKARRSDPDLAARQRAMVRWWFVERSGSLLKAVLRLRWQRAGFIAAELWGGVQGILGEYDRSVRRVARIRRQVALRSVATLDTPARPSTPAAPAPSAAAAEPAGALRTASAAAVVPALSVRPARARELERGP